MPEEWIRIGYETRQRAKMPRIDIRFEAERFADHFIGTGKIMVDWLATWRNWCRRAFNARPEAEPVSVASPSTDHDKLLIDLALRGQRGTWFGPDLIRRAKAKGLLTPDQLKKLGYT